MNGNDALADLHLQATNFTTMKQLTGLIRMQLSHHINRQNSACLLLLDDIPNPHFSLSEFEVDISRQMNGRQK